MQVVCDRPDLCLLQGSGGDLLERKNCLRETSHLLVEIGNHDATVHRTDVVIQPRKALSEGTVSPGNKAYVGSMDREFGIIEPEHHGNTSRWESLSDNGVIPPRHQL